MIMSDVRLTLTDDELAAIVRRERNYLGFSQAVAEMSDLEVLRKGVRRTRALMRSCMKNKPAFVANGALIQFHETQLAFNIERDKGE